MLEVLTYMQIICAAFLLWCVLVALRDKSRFIKADRLGVIERDLVDLVQVVVVAHRVEEPTSNLLRAVKANSLREVPVKYLFLISRSQKSNALSGYYKMFMTIVEIAFAERGDDLNPEDYVRIDNLPYDWTDVPYIFYQCVDKNSNVKRTITFRGNQKCEGIADYYKQVSASSVMAQAILSGAPEEISKDAGFADEIIMESRKHRKGSI